MTITEHDEEGILIDQLKSARWKLEQIKRQQTKLALDKDLAEHELEVIKQAIIDYMEGNGLVQFANCTLGYSESIDCPDLEAIPDDYIRVKTVKEPNKALIKAAKPQGNWYVVKSTPKLTLRGE